MPSNSEENRYNDPSKLTIKKPDIECTAERIARLQEKLNTKSPGWKVAKNSETGECLYYDSNNKNNVKTYFPTPKANCNGWCNIQGGSKKTRRHRKTKTQKRRK
jgi:hypothetical protein